MDGLTGDSSSMLQAGHIDYYDNGFMDITHTILTTSTNGCNLSRRSISRLEVFIL